MNAVAFERALLLYRQDRVELAIKECRGALAQDPHDVACQCLLAICLGSTNQHAEAEATARAAIAQAPDSAWAHFALANVLFQRDQDRSALTAIETAISLDPDEALYHGLQAGIYCSLGNWLASLQAAERGLAINPADSACLNYRTLALTHLGRGAEASAAAETTLRQHPDNATAHVSAGWSLLHQNQPPAALDHFREALRLDPNSDFARAGMLEALKARNPLYRLMLRYFLFTSRLGSRARWILLVGLWLACQSANSTADRYPALAPFIWPAILLYVVFALSTWVARPLGNLTLMASRFGRQALTREERLGAGLVGLLLAGVATLAVLSWQRDDSVLLLGAVVLLGTVPAASHVFDASPGWPRWAIVGYAALVLGLGTGWILTTRSAENQRTALFNDVLQHPAAQAAVLAAGQDYRPDAPSGHRFSQATKERMLRVRDQIVASDGSFAARDAAANALRSRAELLLLGFAISVLMSTFVCAWLTSARRRT